MIIMVNKLILNLLVLYVEGLHFCHDIAAQVVEPSPNVVLINVDDLGWKDLGYMGSSFYETPNIDKLSTESIVFYNAYAAASNCAPARASLMTGQYTPKHGVFTVHPADRGDPKTRKLIPSANNKFISDDSFTLGEMFRKNGYRTGTFGKWHISEDPSQHGFDVNIGGGPQGNPGKNGYFSPYNISNIEDGEEGEYLTDRLTKEAVKFIEDNRDAPFFLYLPYYTVHTPLMGKEDLVDKYKAKKGGKGQDNPKYAAMIHSLDENIGVLLNSLKALGLEENTIVVFTSDNGGIRAISSQDPLRAGKGSYYEGGIRVPMIIKRPNEIKAGSTSDSPIMQIDLFPTFQKIIKAQVVAKELDGVDLIPVLFEGEMIDRDLFFHFPIYLQSYNSDLDQSRDPLFRTRPGSVLISGGWKLHQYFEDDGLELYDLNNDVSEKINLKDVEPAKLEEMLKKLQELQFTYGAPIPTEKNPEYLAN